MASVPAPAPALSIGLGDIYYVIFRHKWKIILLTLAGLVAAGVVYKLKRPTYQSDAKIFIRYVLSEKQPISALGPDANAKSPDQRGETILNSELEILTSADLCKQVAEAFGPAKIMEAYGGGNDAGAAAGIIRRNLTAAIPYRSSVIHVVYTHPSASVAQPVLQELIDQYMKNHRRVHQSAGIIGDFLTQETDQRRARLAQTEDELRKLANKAGVVSTVEEEKRGYATQITLLRQQLFEAQSALEERNAALQVLTNRTPVEPTAETEQPPQEKPAMPPPETIEEIRSLASQLEHLQKAEAQFLVQYTAESPRVREVREKITELTAAKKKIEAEYPALTAVSASANVAPGGPAVDYAEANASIAALQAKIKVLNTQLERVVADANRMSEMEVAISELRRRKEMEEANYRHFAESLDRSRVDEALGNGRVSNIIPIQAPTLSAVDSSKTTKTIAFVAASGLLLSLAWAFAIEFYLDRSVKRARDLERAVDIPLFISMPRVKALLQAKKAGKQDSAKTLPAPADDGSVAPTLVPADGGASEVLRVYHETLRDRMIGYFENKGLTHKPKLIAVTSVGRAAGVTTTAAGLSQSLSDSGEGNVLLIDMTAGQGSAQRFQRGKAVSDLDDLFDARDEAHVEENLYVVTTDSNSDRLSRNLPQRFSKLVPKLKASDFDYIIFDMPPVSQISITPRLAGFMDMVLLVVEAEKTDRDLVQRATALLAESKAHVGAVLNKTRTYGPVQPHQEFLCGV